MTDRYAVEVVDGTDGGEVSAPMEPTFETEPRLAGVLEALRAREPLFHREEVGIAHEDRLRATAPDFWEVGASGRRYGRAHVLDTLERRYRVPVRDVWHVEDFQVREIAGNTYLATYTLFQHERVTRRATLWRASGDDWVILYHQGTMVEPEEGEPVPGP